MRYDIIIVINAKNYVLINFRMFINGEGEFSIKTTTIATLFIGYLVRNSLKYSKVLKHISKFIKRVLNLPTFSTGNSIF